MNIDQLHQFQTKSEEFFNFTGSFPIIGILSGPARVVAGTIQALAGSVFAIVAFIGQSIAKNLPCSESAQKKWQSLKWESAEQAVHGSLNVLNGLGEFFEHTICALGLYGLSAPLTLKIRAEREFNPAFEYGNFSKYYQKVKA
ncbi:hypothetical protein PHSC3_000481 [Chlamydiales bacterium STE3]|nr:hypothetical protein PHSC3_000481 [Chlamydiales bacterium STE3]